MKRALCMILTLSITLSLLALLISCGGGGDDDDQTQSGPTIVDGYIYPPYHDYGRDTVNFEDMKYTRPDFDAAKRKFEEAAALVSDGDISELTALYKEAEELYENASGMTALIGAMYAKSDNDASMLAEYESAASALSELSVSADIARTSAALCSHAENISAEVYGGVLLERYGKFGEYSPSLKTLLYEEAELIHNYEFASSKVTLTFEEVTGTFDYIVETLMLDKIATPSKYAELYFAYSDALSEYRTNVYTEILKCRSKIASRLGVDSYLEYSYSIAGYDPDEVGRLIQYAKSYILPVYDAAAPMYSEFTENTNPGLLSAENLINSLYRTFESMNGELFSVYCYMLQYKLWSLSDEGDGYTSYISGYNAPFIFSGSSSMMSDYSEFLRLFGQYTFLFKSNGADMNGAVGRTAETAMLLLVPFYISSGNSDAVEYLTLASRLSVTDNIITGIMLAVFEESAYSLGYDSVTKEALDQFSREAMLECGMDGSSLSDDFGIEDILKMEDLYLRGGCGADLLVSGIISAELLSRESENSGSGVGAYLAFLSSGSSLSAALSGAGLPSPFSEETVRDASEAISRSLFGNSEQ